MDSQDNLNAKKQDYWLLGTIAKTNRYSTLSEENREEEAKRSTEPKPHFISGVRNINRVTKLLNEIAKIYIL